MKQLSTDTKKLHHSPVISNLLLELPKFNNHEPFDIWVKKRLQNGAHQNTRQAGHHQKQPSRIKTSRERDPFKSEEEGEDLPGMSRVRREKRKFPEMWGREQQQQLPIPARNSRLRGRDRGERRKSWKARKGKEKASSREAAIQEESGGRGEARQTAMEGNQRGMGELAAPGRAYSEGSSSRSSAKNGCFA